MKLDEALELTKPLGRTQFVVAATACFVTFASSFVNLSNVFLAEIPPEFHCSAPSPEVPLNVSVPVNEDGAYSQCQQYGDDAGDTEKCTNGWSYDTELYGESIVTEFDLVCDEGALPDLAQSIVIAGLGVGSLLAGPIADIWGRRPTFIVSLIAFNVVGVAVSFSVNYAMFVTLRFIMAVIHVGYWLPAVVMLYEYLTPRYRTNIGNTPPIFFSIGLLVMSPLAYLVKDWRWFHAALMVPSIAAMPLIWLLPESVRWLLSSHHYDRAEEAMQKVAKFNKATNVPTKFFEECEMTNVGEEEGDTEVETTGDKPTRLGSLDLFKPPLLVITIVMGIQWFSFFLVYFGFALSTGSLAGDPYVSFFISGLFEVPARLIPIWLLRRSGSIIPTSICFAFSGLMMIAMIVLQTGSLGFTICAFFGRFFVTFAFTPLFLLSSDLFPTPIRNAGTGMVQLFGRVGSVLSPLLLYWDTKLPGLAFSSMAAVACFAAVIIFLVPESLNTVHPSTKEDVRILVQTRRLITLNGCRKPTAIPEQSDTTSTMKQDTSGTIVNGHVDDDTQPRLDNPAFEESTRL